MLFAKLNQTNCNGVRSVDSLMSVPEILTAQIPEILAASADPNSCGAAVPFRAGHQRYLVWDLGLK